MWLCYFRRHICLRLGSLVLKSLAEQVTCGARAVWAVGGKGDEEGFGTFRNNSISQRREEQSLVAGETSHTRCRRLGLGDVSASEPTVWTALSRPCAESENQSPLYEGASSLQRKNMRMSSNHDEFRNVTLNVSAERLHIRGWDGVGPLRKSYRR